MVNVLYDFNGLSPWFVPYIGAGVGYLGISENWHAINNLGSRCAEWCPRHRGSGLRTSTQAVSGVRTEHEGRVRLPGDPRRRLPASDRYAWLGAYGRISLPRHHRKPHLQRHRDRYSSATSTPAAAGPSHRDGFRSARATTTPSWSACATTSVSRRRRRRLRPRSRRRRRPAPTWCSSIGTRRRSPIARARSSGKRRTTRPRCSTRGSR